MANKKSVVATNCLYYFYTSRVECFVASCRCVSEVPKHHLNQLLICPAQKQIGKANSNQISVLIFNKIAGILHPHPLKC